MSSELKQESEYVRLQYAYGRLRAQTDYELVGEGKDFVTVKGGGALYSVPNMYLMTDGERRRELEEARRAKREEEGEDEDGVQY